MKRIISILSISICLSCYQPERNCSDYKTGFYKFDYTVDGVNKTAQFKRTKDYSIDYIDDKIDSSSIRWINDCEFILTKINPKTNSEKKPLHFKILTTTDSSYVFEYKLAAKDLNKLNKKEKGIAIKIDNL